MQKVNLQQPTGKVVIAQNIQKVSERLDMYGNVIDPKTKQIIKKADDNSNQDESILRG
jgi:hypothetical protein